MRNKNSGAEKGRLKRWGGKRAGSGRPLKSGVYRVSVTWRLPADLVTRIGLRAQLEEIEVTTWVEGALRQALQVPSVLRPDRA